MTSIPSAASLRRPWLPYVALIFGIVALGFSALFVCWAGGQPFSISNQPHRWLANNWLSRYWAKVSKPASWWEASLYWQVFIWSTTAVKNPPKKIRSEVILWHTIRLIVVYIHESKATSSKSCPTPGERWDGPWVGLRLDN